MGTASGRGNGPTNARAIMPLIGESTDAKRTRPRAPRNRVSERSSIARTRGAAKARPTTVVLASARAARDRVGCAARADALETYEPGAIASFRWPSRWLITSRQGS